MKSSRYAIVSVPLFAASISSSALGAAVTTGATSPDASGLTSAVDDFRAVAGSPANAAGAGPFDSGRRQISWDGGAATDPFVSPALMPNNFFNSNVKQGNVYLTPGSGFLLSQRAAAANFTAPRFGDINPSYASEFITFSAERLFAAKDSVITDVFFFVPSSPATPATVASFGAVFADVDSDAATFMEFFDLDGSLLHTAFASPRDKGLSLLGASFDAGERIARVRIHAGTTPMGATNFDGGASDIVVMDDFIYSEPLAVPGPGAAGVLVLAGLAGVRRRR